MFYENGVLVNRLFLVPFFQSNFVSQILSTQCHKINRHHITSHEINSREINLSRDQLNVLLDKSIMGQTPKSFEVFLN